MKKGYRPSPSQTTHCSSSDDLWFGTLNYDLQSVSKTLLNKWDIVMRIEALSTKTAPLIIHFYIF